MSLEIINSEIPKIPEIRASFVLERHVGHTIIFLYSNRLTYSLTHSKKFREYDLIVELYLLTFDLC